VVEPVVVVKVEPPVVMRATRGEVVMADALTAVVLVEEAPPAPDCAVEDAATVLPALSVVTPAPPTAAGPEPEAEAAEEPAEMSISICVPNHRAICRFVLT